MSAATPNHMCRPCASLNLCARTKASRSPPTAPSWRRMLLPVIVCSGTADSILGRGGRYAWVSHVEQERVFGTQLLYCFVLHSTQDTKTYTVTQSRARTHTHKQTQTHKKNKKNKTHTHTHTHTLTSSHARTLMHA